MLKIIFHHCHTHPFSTDFLDSAWFCLLNVYSSVDQKIRKVHHLARKLNLLSRLRFCDALLLAQRQTNKSRTAYLQTKLSAKIMNLSIKMKNQLCGLHLLAFALVMHARSGLGRWKFDEFIMLVGFNSFELLRFFNSFEKSILITECAAMFAQEINPVN